MRLTKVFFCGENKVCPHLNRGKDSRGAEGGHWTERSEGSGWSDSGTPNSLFLVGLFHVRVLPNLAEAQVAEQKLSINCSKPTKSRPND